MSDSGVEIIFVSSDRSPEEMKDYMKHLYIKHNYMSMKMKFHQIQFPKLGNNNHENDGFGHIHEPEESSEEVVDGVIVDVNPSIIKGTVTPICSIF